MLTVYVEPSNRDFRLDCKWEINLHCKYNVFFKILLARCWKFKISVTRCWNWSWSDEYMNFIYWNRGNYEEKNVNTMLAIEDATYSIQLRKESLKKSGLILPARCWIFKILTHHIISICCTCNSGWITHRSNSEFSWHLCSSLMNHLQAFIYIVLRWKGNAMLIF